MRSNQIITSRHSATQWHSEIRKSSTEHHEHRLQILNRLVAASFHPIWHWLIEVVIVLSIFNAIYVTFFDNDADTALFYYCLEVIFLYDTLIAYIHRFRVRKFSLNPPRNVIILLIDTVSLLPIYICCYIAYPQSATRLLQNRQQLKNLLRGVHLVASLFLARFHSIKMHVALMKVTHVFLQLLMNLLLACWWSIEGSCWPNCEKPNWTDSLQHLTELQLDKPLTWFLTCYTTMGDVLIHGSPGFLIDHNDTEAFIILAAMIIGFTMHSFFEVAHTFNNYIDVIQPRYDYKFHIRKLHLLFDSCPNDSSIKETWCCKKRTLQYYDMLWRRRKGITLADELIQELPMILVKEILVDVFHEALIHSHLFTKLSYALKKELCLCMRTEYYLPGDYLFVPGQSYARMLYLHSGVVNVVSHEDHQTPVLALAAGTLLGETSLCMGHVSKARMQCATECEVKLLPMASYNRLVLRYHDNFKYVHDEIKLRIRIARSRLQSMTRAKREKHTGSGAGCKRLKKQWRCASSLHAHEVKHASITKQMWDELDKGFYSKYLDSIALADRLTANRRIICLNAKCPYVMHPDSSFRKFFVYLHLVVVVIHTLLLPYYFVFMDETPQALVIANLVMDIVFFFDIYLQLITFVVVDGDEIIEPRKIVQYKLKEISFLVDIISVFPYEYPGFFAENSDDVPYLSLRLPKLIQWYKIVERIMRLEANSVEWPYLLIALKYFIIYFTTLYLSTCYHYVWFNFGQHGPHPGTPNSPIAERPILNCILYNLSAICLLGLTERMPISMHAMLMYSLLTFIGCYLLNFCIVEFSCNFVKNNEVHNRHLKYLKTVDDFLMANSLILHYKQSLHDYFGFLWQYNRNITMKPDPAMPEYEIYLKNMIRLVRQVPAFAHLSDKLLELLAARAHFRVHPPGYELSSVDDRNIHLHIIAKGYCLMELFMPGDREKNITKTLEPGDCFNILEVFLSLNSFNTIKTLTAVEEISIRGTDIWDVLDTDKTEMGFFKDALKWLATKNETILNVNKLSDFLVPHKMEVPKSKHVTFFKYSIDDNHDFDGGNTKKKKLRKQLGILYYYVLKDTIDPQKKCFIAWEIFRSMIAISFGFMTFLTPTVLVNFTLAKNVAYLCTVVVFAIDAYVRLHLHYYNDENIKVTYIHNTMEHYVKTSIALDIIAMIPIVVWPFYIAYSFTLNMVLYMIYYTALFHRPVQGLMYVEENFNDVRRFFATAFRNTIIVLAVVGIVANNMLLAVCTYRPESGYNCRSTVNYISTSPFVNNTKTWDLLIFQLHAVSERIHSDIVGVSEYPLMDNIIESLAINKFLWCFKLYLMSKMIASTIGTNAIMLSKAKTQFNNFISFIKYEIISEETAEEVKGHFEYVNTKHEGYAINDLLWKFPDKVRLDLKERLFTQTLHMTQFFHVFSISAMRVYFDDFDMRYYKIGADIIRCNDVQGNIYVVSKGAVNIIVAADTLITLTRGGAFGCFSENGITRQTILARAAVHVELLAISTATFYKHLAPYHSLIHKFRVQMERNVEYFEPTKPSQENLHTIGQYVPLLLGLQLACYKCYDKFNQLIRLSSKSYKIYSLAVIHVAALSSIILICVCFLRRYWIVAIFCYICDLFFWVHIIIMFHMQYIDPETGIYITTPNLIRKRYAQSLAFWVTLLGTLPIEVIPLIAHAETFVVEWFFLNRLLRFALAMIYNHELNKKLSHNTWFQWLYVVYLMMFQIGFMSLIWCTVACHLERCMHRVSSGPKKEMGYSEDRNEILLSILYVVILFTAAGVRTVSSVTINQITVTMFISTASLIITSSMIGVLASLLIIKDISSNRYKTKVKRVKLYFGSLHLSPFLRSRIYQSMVILWMLRRGELLPAIILEAPDYIRQDVMMSMYGMHLTQHKLFGKMHKDMLRQICTLLKVGLYAPDQVIVSTGDRDGCMYFLHRGQIRITDEETGQSYVVSQVYSFGEEQGVYDVVHRRTYTAYTIIDLLLLEKNVWKHLLEWYPASKEVITSSFEEYCGKEDDNLHSSRVELNIID